MPNPKPHKLVIAGPAIPFRFSRRELFILRFGSYCLRKFVDTLNIGADLELWQRLDGLATEVLRLADDRLKSHRLHADALGLAALAFCLRQSSREVRLHPVPFGWREGVPIVQLSNKLEVLRKRAKRLALAKDPTGYQSWRKRWLRFLKGVQRYLRVMKVKASAAKGYKQDLEGVLSTTRAVLAERKIAFDEKNLRPIVRKLMHHVRRERGWASIGDLVMATKNGRAFIAEFVGRELRILYWQRRALEPSAWEMVQSVMPHLDDDNDDGDSGRLQTE